MRTYITLFTINMLYISSFVINFELGLVSIACSVTHALFSSYLTYIIAGKRLNSNIGLNSQIIFILVNLFYTNISCVKYFSDELYPDFISDNITRLTFSILSMIVLWACSLLVRKRYDLEVGNFIKINRSGLLNVILIFFITILTYLMYATYKSGEIYQYYAMAEIREIGMEQSNRSLAEKIIEFFSGILINILPVLVALKFKKNFYNLFMAIGFLVAISYSVIFASRAVVMYYYFSLFISHYYLFGVKKSYIIYPVVFGPLLIAASTFTLMPITKNLDSLDGGEVLRQLTYRFDVTDFAATNIVRNDLAFNHEIISDAIIYSIPKSIFQSKYSYMNDAYGKSVSAVGLNPDVDYTDSIFSIGAQIFGLLGFMLFPVVFVYLIGLFESIIHHFFKWQSIYIIPCSAILFTRIENDLSGFLADWRFSLVYIVIGVILFNIFRPLNFDLKNNQYNRFKRKA